MLPRCLRFHFLISLALLVLGAVLSQAELGTRSSAAIAWATQAFGQEYDLAALTLERATFA
jgi:hypothetical protein